MLNLETPTVAVTTNFVSKAGLPQALRWVRSGDAELVSGVRGAEARALLAQRWEAALREKAPREMKEAEERMQREDAAVEERRRKGRELASLFREEKKEAEDEEENGVPPSSLPAAAAAAAVAAAAASNGGGFSFNFAVED